MLVSSTTGTLTLLATRPSPCSDRGKSRGVTSSTLFEPRAVEAQPRALLHDRGKGWGATSSTSFGPRSRRCGLLARATYLTVIPVTLHFSHFCRTATLRPDCLPDVFGRAAMTYRGLQLDIGVDT